MRRQRGLTLIETMIAISLLGMLAAFAVPGYSAWLLNSQIRSATESFLHGLEIARVTALKTNANVRFQMVDALTSACAIDLAGGSWVASLEGVAGLCHRTSGANVAPRIVQKSTTRDESPQVSIAGNASGVVTFDSLGRVRPQNADGTAPLSRIDFGVPVTMLSAADQRNLRILVDRGGNARICDPKVTAAGDPRRC